MGTAEFCRPETKGMNLLLRLGLLAAAGGLGTVLRYGANLLAARVFGGGFPWGTLLVNVVGCLLFGCLWVLAEERRFLGPESRLILLTGFLGGLTTFSSYGFESADFLRKNQWGLAGLNLLVENSLGIAAVFAGMALGRWVRL